MNTGNTMDVKIVKNDAYTTVNLVGNGVAENVSELTQIIPTLIAPSPQDVIVNCQNLSGLSAQWVRALMQMHQKLKSVNKQVRLIYVQENIVRFLRQEGVESSLRTFDHLRTALEDIGVKTPKMLDVNFINPFLSATIKVLATQTSTKATAGQVYKKSAQDKFLGDISGVIGLVSDAFTGSVVISFPAPTFLKLMSRMLGEEFTSVTREIQDGAGEFTNIIFGQAKVMLNEQGFGIKTALPSVITGNDHTVVPMSSGPRVVIPFETDVGPFFIEICVSA